MVKLTESTNGASERLARRQCHHTSLNSLAEMYHTEIKNHRLQVSKPENKRLSRYSLRMSQSYASPQEALGGEFGQAGDNVMPALETMLRRFGISLSSLQKAETVEAVNDILKEKRLHMMEILESFYATAAFPLIPGLESANKVTQLLSSALYRDSDFEYSLKDDAQQQRAADLEKRIGAVQKGLENLNTDILHHSDRAREDFMERWGPE